MILFVGRLIETLAARALNISYITGLHFSWMFQVMIAVAAEGRRGCAVMKEQATTTADAVRPTARRTQDSRELERWTIVAGPTNPLGCRQRREVRSNTPRRKHYSARRTSTGCTLVARSAGPSPASSTTSASVPVAAT